MNMAKFCRAEVSVIWNEAVLRDIIEGRMKGKALRGRKRPHMLSDLASSTKYLEVKRAAENQEGWRATSRRGMP